MKLQQLYSYARKAIEDYHMIEEGDKIAIGISGGKDSLTLLYALHGLMRFYPKKYSIEAITVDLGFQNLDIAGVKKLCDELEVPYTVVKTEIAEIIFHQRKESNPCSLCAKMRKGALNQAMKIRQNYLAATKLPMLTTRTILSRQCYYPYCMKGDFILLHHIPIWIA